MRTRVPPVGWSVMWIVCGRFAAVGDAVTDPKEGVAAALGGP
jgi:hypothetical protein